MSRTFTAVDSGRTYIAEDDLKSVQEALSAAYSLTQTEQEEWFAAVWEFKKSIPHGSKTLFQGLWEVTDFFLSDIYHQEKLEAIDNERMTDLARYIRHYELATEQITRAAEFGSKKNCLPTAFQDRNHHQVRQTQLAVFHHDLEEHKSDYRRKYPSSSDAKIDDGVLASMTESFQLCTEYS